MSTASPIPHRKRKRAPSSTSTSTTAVINPLSHPPDTLRQFALAGHPVDQPLPSKLHPGFPHRAPRVRSRGGSKHTLPDADSDSDSANLTLPRPRPPPSSSSPSAPLTAASDADIDTATEHEPDSGWETTTSTATSTARTSRTRRGKDIDRRAQSHRARLGLLTTLLRRALAQGDVATARRAFGLLARARVRGRKVDLRWEGFWEVGVEVLMREADASSAGGENGAMGWGEEYSEAGRLGMFLRFLMQQYPYSRQHVASSAGSAVGFRVALFAGEMEGVWEGQRRGLERFRGEEEDEVMGGFDDEEVDGDHERGRAQLEDDEDHLRGVSQHERRLRRRENELRLEALRRMTDLAQRMDTAMETVPFSRDPELLRLRAMVALYVGDLSVPPPPRSQVEEVEGKRARGLHRGKARELLLGVKERAGRLKEHDELLLRELESDDEEEDGDGSDEGPSVLPMFSSMDL
ncbi:RNA polymerase I-specific transcription initiation factor rrn11 [Staphylotrichum tortipilum]|uniref:RNA polymerase I-specific transcription initiation factor rrn11 n=1 Tax=Staphylotrichum tortipilum TaxID=2831512 RepID=A0AAN6RPJ3_9PEZI|nr:RNA polymerase I-specific transcription initiation factor rrn11 [Staphylotrichum longicolle]